MKKQFTIAVTILAAVIMLGGSTRAQQTPASNSSQTPAAQAPASQTPAAKAPAAAGTTHHATAAKSAAPLVLKTDKDKASYAIGLNMGKSMQKDAVDIDPNILARGLKDGMAGGKTKALMTDEEAAAVTLGAGGFTVFRQITLPNVRWALLYGVLLCNARAMGEFGAVSVVSGKIRGLTNTLPLHIEALYNDYDFVGAFAAASLLASLGLVTLVLKTGLEWRYSDELSHARKR